MTIELELDGRRRQVMLRREGEHWVAGIDGRELAVTAVEVGGRWSMLVGRTSYEVSIEPRPGSDLIVHVNGTGVPLSIVDRRQRRRRGAPDGGDGRPYTIVAPMPGRIVKVLVSPGETVQPRQGLVVVEAMKMENELRAPRGGTVAEVRVAEGVSVEANAVLLVLE